jgi:hypothetical protein
LYPRRPTFIEQLLGEYPSGAELDIMAALDRVLTGGRMSQTGELEAARALLDAAPFFASGLPVLIAPYHLTVD